MIHNYYCCCLGHASNRVGGSTYGGTTVKQVGEAICERVNEEAAADETSRSYGRLRGPLAGQRGRPSHPILGRGSTDSPSCEVAMLLHSWVLGQPERRQYAEFFRAPRVALLVSLQTWNRMFTSTWCDEWILLLHNKTPGNPRPNPLFPIAVGNFCIQVMWFLRSCMGVFFGDMLSQSPCCRSSPPTIPHAGLAPVVLRHLRLRVALHRLCRALDARVVPSLGHPLLLGVVAAARRMRSSVVVVW